MTADTIAHIRDYAKDQTFANGLLALLEPPHNTKSATPIRSDVVVFAYGSSDESKSKRRQFGGGSKALELGTEIAAMLPDIALDYRYLNALEIIEKYRLDDIYMKPLQSNRNVLINAVRIALRKLLPQEDYTSLARQHMKKAQGEAGKESKQKRSGIFGREGIFLWSQHPEVAERTLALCNNSDFQYPKGPNKGRPNYNAISAKIENEFGILIPRKAIETFRNRPSKP